MWKNINISRNLVKAETEKAVLIAMPHNSDYNGFRFWHPARCVREGRNSSAISIEYTEEFVFRLIKYGKGKYNSREVIDELQLSCDEIEEAFEALDENISAPKRKSDCETYKPTMLTAIERAADESLIDDE